MVWNQKTKQLSWSQTRHRCSHPGLLPSVFLPLATQRNATAKHEQALVPWLHWSNSAIFPSLASVTKHLIRCQRVEDNSVSCNEGFWIFQDLCFASLLIFTFMQHFFNTWEIQLRCDVSPWQPGTNVLNWSISSFLHTCSSVDETEKHLMQLQALLQV